jgi:recombination associated protein RdgC
MFKNALVYRITQWDQTSLDNVDERLTKGRFTECGATQAESAGWIEPRGDKHTALLERIGGQLILRLCVERKAVPSSAIKQKLEQRLDKIEQETGRRPKGKQAKELKEEIVQDLLPRAFPKRASTLVWIAPQLGWVVVNAGSMKSADRIITLLVETLGGGIVLKALQTQTSPAVAMAEWLQSKEAPAGFTIDRECELKQPDSEKACVRYARHTLDIDEVAEHIAQGKMPTQVAMTWSDRVSFVLTEGLAIKKIKLLDVVLESNASATGKDDGGFDADVAISTGELTTLIPDIIDALGGELPLGQMTRGVTTPTEVKPAKSKPIEAVV